MFKVLLVSPAFGMSISSQEVKKDRGLNITGVPLGILYIGTLLQKNGYDVKLVYGVADPEYYARIKEDLLSADVIGFSVMTSQMFDALKLSKLAKTHNVPVVWGGPHPTLFPNQVMENENVDYVVKKEGELTMLDLCNTLKEGRDVSGIDGLLYKKNGKIIENKDRPFMNMNELPLINWDFMDRSVLDALKLLPAHTSRGCPSRCTFCINEVTCNKWRAMDIEHSLTQIEDFVSRFRKDVPIKFQDENFFVNKKRAEGICRGIIDRKLNIQWVTNVRCDYFSNGFVDDNLLALMKKSGCLTLHLGAESGSQRMLDFLKKDITVDEILFSAKQCKKFDIMPRYSFMCGLPTETREDVKKTIDVIDRILKICPKASFFGPRVYRPQYPDGELYEICKKMGWKGPQTIEEWANLSMKEWSFVSANDLPWIPKKDVAFFESLEPIVRFGTRPLKNSLISTVNVNAFSKLAFSILAKIRWKLKFFVFPFEYKIAINVLKKKAEKKFKMREQNENGD